MSRLRAQLDETEIAFGAATVATGLKFPRLRRDTIGAVLAQYFLPGTSEIGRICAYWRVWYGVSGQRRLDITRIVVLENREEENR